MLVRNSPLGAALGELFHSPSNTTNTTSIDHPLVLMRGHGFTTVDSSIETAVYRAFYAQANARIQTTAIGLASAFGSQGTIDYLSEREQLDTSVWNQALWDKPWLLWVRQVERSPVYDNSLGPLVTNTSGATGT